MAENILEITPDNPFGKLVRYSREKIRAVRLAEQKKKIEKAFDRCRTPVEAAYLLSKLYPNYNEDPELKKFLMQIHNATMQKLNPLKSETRKEPIPHDMDMEW